MQPDPGLQFYKPGNSVNASGIYAVCHTQEHRGSQEVVLNVPQDSKGPTDPSNSPGYCLRMRMDLFQLLGQADLR